MSEVAMTTHHEARPARYVADARGPCVAKTYQC